jgi:Fe(3+) dicitrate transport protein
MKRWVVVLTTGVMVAQMVMGTETNQNAEEARRLPEVTVYGTAEGQEVGVPFLPDVEGAHIYSGKKTAVIDLQSPPQIQNNNYRQALAKTPGLLLSEETSPLLSLGYRGLNPHRAQFTQVLKDGIPIHADQFGYPEAYYTPPLEQVHHIDFVHGGAALQYGPQPGGALNYVTHMPRTDKPFSLRTHHTFGSDNFYSTYNAVDGTEGRLGYYAYVHHRETDGFRTANSDVAVYSGSLKLVLDANEDSRWIFGSDGYQEEHGEPGGLTRRSFFANSPPANAVFYEENRNANTRDFDRFRLERYFGNLTFEHDISEATLLTVKGWTGYYLRFSKRQRGGGFGLTPTGAAADSNDIEKQEFYTTGVDARLRHNWEAWGNQHTLAGGAMFYHTFSPRADERGATPNADNGVTQRDTDRRVLYTPAFVENQFRFGRLAITPGVRLENVWQTVRENVNVAKASPDHESDHDFVPLFGVGAQYDLAESVQVYGNASQSYRPKIFTEAVPTGGNTVVPRDLDPGMTWQYEIGVRGRPKDYFYWDTSVFLLNFDDQIGGVTVAPGTNSFENIGRSVHMGVEAAAELDVIGLIDDLRGTKLADSIGSFTVYANAMFLDAELKSGDFKGNTPQYAPDSIIRTGVNYRWRDRVKLSLLGTYVDEHFADDNNTPSRFIPAYGVWDLTAEARLYKDIASVVAGINNLFDEDYYARIRADGIDPAYRRNYYGGVKILLP